MTVSGLIDHPIPDHITTVRISSVFVIRDEHMRKAAIELFRNVAWQLHTRVQALGDQRASTKIEHRNGIENWTIEEIEPVEADDFISIADTVREFTPDYSRPAVSDQINERMKEEP